MLTAVVLSMVLCWVLAGRRWTRCRFLQTGYLRQNNARCSKFSATFVLLCSCLPSRRSHPFSRFLKSA